jgi:membrane-bound lytic murein transglycosylase B
LQWLKSGIHFKDRPPSIPSTTPLTLVVPDGGDGRAYLVSQNFDVIMSWNKSTYFALTVGLLSDYIAKSSPLVTQPAFNE